MIKDFDIFDRFDLFGGGAGSGRRTRYFTDLTAASLHHYTIPSASPDRIVMDVYSPTGITTGLPTGAPVPTAAKLDTLDFVYAGSLTEIGKNGASYFDGFIANVKLYSSGTLIRQYDIKETWLNDLVLYDNVNDQHGLAVNITSADAEKYSFDNVDQAWLGGELVVNGGFDADSDWSKGAGWTIGGGLATCDGTQAGNSDLQQDAGLLDGLRYRTAYSITSYVAGNSRIIAGNIGGAGANHNEVGVYTEDVTCDVGPTLKNRADANFIGSIDNISVKRLIELA